MSGEMSCPVCGTVISPDSRFCKKCGKAIERCPACQALVPPGLMFCPKCSAPLPDANASGGDTDAQRGEDEPYVVWEGFPFSILSKTSMTRAQWKITLWITIICSAMMVALLLVQALNEESEGQCCLGTMAGAFAVMMAVGLLLKHKMGRETAEVESRRRPPTA